MINQTNTGRAFGYARVSTEQQSLEIQRDLLLAQGIQAERIITDKASGKDTDRTGLQELILKAESGDTIFVSKMDRLGRNTLDMLTLVTEFKEKGIVVNFFQEGISTASETGTMVITILAAVAQSERTRILERTREGRVAAMAKGIAFGPKVKYDKDVFQDLFEAGTRPKDLMAEMNISPSTYYRLKKELLEFKAGV